MWHWSVFVLLHLSDATQRRACVKDVLGRHVKLGDPESNDREVFLQDQLDIPSAWIAEAKAMSAATAGDYGDQVNLLKMS
jgi:nuclear pore complex protein Nup98-Nup96